MKNYLDSKHYGYACDIARDGKAKTVVDLLERIEELEASLRDLWDYRGHAHEPVSQQWFFDDYPHHRATIEGLKDE